MKRIYGIVISTCFIFLSCSKTPVIENKPLPGRWTLVETLTDPGDGSGKWMTVNMPNHYFLNFETGNSLESNISRGNGNAMEYSILNESSLYLIYPQKDTVSYTYHIQGVLLTLEGGCYERCGIKFKKDE